MKASGRPHLNVTRTSGLRLEMLEGREVPSVTFRIDYSHDTTGFFNDPARRAAIEQVAASLSGALHDEMSAIVPSGANSWATALYNPLTGGTIRQTNPVIAQNEFIIYVAGGNLPGSVLGMASSGAWSASGSQAWLDTVRARGQSGILQSRPADFSSWGGLVAFSEDRSWYFGNGTPARNQFDFATVAKHEILHLLGFGLSESVYAGHIQNGHFVGPNAMASYGGPIPMDTDHNHGSPSVPDHWREGVLSKGQETIMMANLPMGVKRGITALEWAVLADLGWEVNASNTTPSTTPSRPQSTPSNQMLTDTGEVATTAFISTQGGPVQFAVGGDAGSIATVAAVGGNGRYSWMAQPFPEGYTGGVRVATGDFNGDGVKDVVVGSGPGAPSLVRVLDGLTQAVLFSVQPFESAYLGGVYVAAGDLNGDGKAELVITPDQGGGPRVQVYNGANFSILADFWGIEDPNFRGGVRASIGNMSPGRSEDLIVAAGIGGGPRVAGYRGSSIRQNASPEKLFADFYAFESSLRNGVFVAVGDVNNDGRADLIVGGGPGGGPRVTVFGGKALTNKQKVILADFFAGDPSTRGGVRVAAADLNGDGRADVLVGSGENTGSRLIVYPGQTVQPSQTPSAMLDFEFFPGYRGGIFVG